MRNVSGILAALAAASRFNPMYRLSPEKLSRVTDCPAFLAYARGRTNLKRDIPRFGVDYAYRDAVGNIVNRVRQAKKGRGLSSRQERQLRKAVSRVSRCQQAGHLPVTCRDCGPMHRTCSRCGVGVQS